MIKGLTVGAVYIILTPSCGPHVGGLRGTFGPLARSLRQLAQIQTLIKSYNKYIR